MSRGDTPFRPRRVLVIGASYGLLPAIKIAAADHAVTVVGHPSEVALIAQHGASLDFGEGRVLRPPLGDTALSFTTPGEVDPSGYEIAFLAIQEPQARSPEIASLLKRIGGVMPIASLMNMPPPPFLDRIPSLPPAIRAGVYGAAEVWAALPAERMTLASPDPQVFRPDPARPGDLRVTLASNFKFAPFARPEDQEILAQIARDASRVEAVWGRVPVHLLAKGSVFAPLAKWPMLITGNCRCLTPDGSAMSIRDAVGRDPEQSRRIYDALCKALLAIGAPPAALVPFDAYRRAAEQLVRPSSLARALASGAREVERYDLLALGLLRETGAAPEMIEALRRISAMISERLDQNRAALQP
ncbi:hypothetical protein OE699_10445 [Sedimentimonas flavescens]|uniref:Ketopantoate reductase n=1 Tax=Sedimentimonas flavescens TaxID=2851012 RepID=A0ABT3A028_9RHOB|nr:hypothetical protein [Sedimentimonas flavescens]MCV2879276.1 hypothetical protein [Sedimentimonas flavescens]